MSISAIALLGAPGAGKGTISAGIKAKTPWIHVSSGDLLRDAVDERSDVGREAESYMKQGDLVPDEIILRIVTNRIDRGPDTAQYLFDGFPRTLVQAKLLKDAFDERNAVLLCVLLLQVPREVTLERLSGRRICRNCGANFHVRNIPPRKEGVCDHCGGDLYQRPDDTEATILNRLDVFNRQSKELFSYYEEQGLLVRIDSSGRWQDVVDEILGMLEAQAGVDRG